MILIQNYSWLNNKNNFGVSSQIFIKSLHCAKNCAVDIGDLAVIDTYGI